MGGVPLPEGYHSVNPYIVVDDAERLIDPGPPMCPLRLRPGCGRHLPCCASGRSDLDPGADRAVLGDRTCGFVDPFDNRWWVATHLREFS
jgi:hypothetical protein